MTDKTFRRIVVATIVACFLSLAATVGTVYSVVNQQIVATNLCDTINASRGPDTGTRFSSRQEYRDIWTFLNQPERAKRVPDAPPLDCITGKPIQQKG